MTLVKIFLTLNTMKFCYVLAWPFYSRIWNFYIYFYTLLGTPNLRTPNKNIFNNRKWKDEGCTHTGVRRPAPSLEMSLVNMPRRNPAAKGERRTIPHTRHTFFKSELSSRSVFRVEGLPPSQDLSEALFPITTDSSEVRAAHRSACPRC